MGRCRTTGKFKKAMWFSPVCSFARLPTTGQCKCQCPCPFTHTVPLSIHPYIHPYIHPHRYPPPFTPLYGDPGPFVGWARASRVPELCSGAPFRTVTNWNSTRLVSKRALRCAALRSPAQHQHQRRWVLHRTTQHSTARTGVCVHTPSGLRRCGRSYQIADEVGDHAASFHWPGAASRVSAARWSAIGDEMR